MGWPGLEIVGIVVPAGVGHERAVRAERVEERLDNGAAATDDPAEGAHPGVHHQDTTWTDAEGGQIGGELPVGDRRSELGYGKTWCHSFSSTLLTISPLL